MSEFRDLILGIERKKPLENVPFFSMLDGCMLCDLSHFEFLEGKLITCEAIDTRNVQSRHKEVRHYALSRRPTHYKRMAHLLDASASRQSTATIGRTGNKQDGTNLLKVPPVLPIFPYFLVYGL